MTQDLGTAVERFKQMIFRNSFIPLVMNKIITSKYCFNSEKIRLRLGKSIVSPFYGMVELPEGKMKSREGTVVDADDLMQNKCILP